MSNISMRHINVGVYIWEWDEDEKKWLNAIVRKPNGLNRSLNDAFRSLNSIYSMYVETKMLSNESVDFCWPLHTLTTSTIRFAKVLVDKLNAAKRLRTIKQQFVTFQMHFDPEPKNVDKKCENQLCCVWFKSIRDKYFCNYFFFFLLFIFISCFFHFGFLSHLSRCLCILRVKPFTKSNQIEQMALHAFIDTPD